MSRYTFEGNRPALSIIVGWDNPLESFFAQVWDADEPEDRDLKLWAGAGPQRVTTVATLAMLVAPYGQIPAEILAQLAEDYGQRAAPTFLQRLYSK